MINGWSRQFLLLLSLCWLDKSVYFLIISTAVEPQTSYFPALQMTECSSHFFPLSWTKTEVIPSRTSHDCCWKKSKLVKSPFLVKQTSPWRRMTESLTVLIVGESGCWLCAQAAPLQPDEERGGRGGRGGEEGKDSSAVGVLGEFRKCCFLMVSLQRENFK